MQKKCPREGRLAGPLIQDYDPRENGVTYSILRMWLTCRYKCLLYLMGLRSPKVQKALRIGSYVHKLLELDYPRSGIDPTVVINFDEDGDEQDCHKDLALSTAMVEARMAHFKAWDEEYDWEAPEHEFDVQFEGYRLRGKIDGIVQRNGKLWLYERKTTSGFSDELQRNCLMMDLQIRFYMLAASIEMGEPIAGVVYEMLQKPGYRVKKNQTLEQYFTEVRTAIMQDPDKYFTRYEVYNDKARFTEFTKSLKMKLEGFEQWCLDEAGHRTYRNETACGMYGGCTYLEACASGKLVNLNSGGTLMGELDNGS